MFNFIRRLLPGANTMFPGKPNYVGPVKGVFGFLHHEILVEYSHNALERVDYIIHNKPTNEVPTRLNNLIFLGKCKEAVALYKEGEALDIEDDNARKIIGNDQAIDEQERARRFALQTNLFDKKYKEICNKHEFDIMKYVKKYIPNPAWDGTQLIFPESDTYEVFR